MDVTPQPFPTPPREGPRVLGSSSRRSLRASGGGSALRSVFVWSVCALHSAVVRHSSPLHAPVPGSCAWGGGIPKSEGLGDCLWLFAASAHDLACMIGNLEHCMRSRAGLSHRHEKCNQAEVNRNDQDPRPTPQDIKRLDSVRSMEQVPSKGCMQVLGRRLQLNGGREKVFAHTIQAAWAALHSKRLLWAACGR